MYDVSVLFPVKSIPCFNIKYIPLLRFVSFLGKGVEDKRGQSVAPGVAEKSWLYLSGNAVVCTRHMEVAAIISGINPAINATMDSVEMGSLQQVILAGENLFDPLIILFPDLSPLISHVICTYRDLTPIHMSFFFLHDRFSHHFCFPCSVIELR